MATWAINITQGSAGSSQVPVVINAASYITYKFQIQAPTTLTANTYNLTFTDSGGQVIGAYSEKIKSGELSAVISRNFLSSYNTAGTVRTIKCTCTRSGATGSSIETTIYLLPKTYTACTASDGPTTGTNIRTYKGSSQNHNCTWTTGCIVYDGNIYATNAGTYSITLKLPTDTFDTHYRWDDNSSGNKTVYWTIFPKQLTGLIWQNSKQYDGSNYTGTATVSTTEGLIFGDSCTFNYSTTTISGKSYVGVKHYADSGLATTTATSTKNTNYSLPSSGLSTQLSITQRPVTISWTNSTKSWPYDNTPHDAVPSLGNIITGDSCTANCSGTATNVSDTGNKTTVNSLSNSDYKLPTTGLTCVLTITQKPVSITWGTTSFTYNGSEQKASATTSDIIANTNCSLAFSGGATHVNDTGNKTTVSLSGTGAGNYTFATGVDTQKAITITAKEIGLSWGTHSWTFDGDPHTASATATGLCGNDTCTVTTTGSAQFVGNTGPSEATSLSNNDYTIPNNDAIKKCTLEIRQKEITVSWTGVTKSWIYDGQDYYATPILSGWAKDWDCDPILSTPAKNVGDTGPTTITGLCKKTGQSTDYSGNYKLPTSGLTQSVSITPRTVSVSWTGASWTYNGKPYGATPSIGNTISGDTFTLTYGGTATNVGDTGPTTLTDLGNGNYKLPTDGTASCSLTVIPLTATLQWGLKCNGTTAWGTTSQVYTGNTYVPQCRVANIVSGDTCSVNLDKQPSLTNVADANPKTITAQSFSGADSGNYALPMTKSQDFYITRATCSYPSSTPSVVFNGQLQSPSAAYTTTGATTSGNSKIYVGTYTNAGTLTPDANHCWSNGTYNAKTFSWSISKCTPTISITGTPLSITGLNTITINCSISPTLNSDYFGEGYTPDLQTKHPGYSTSLEATADASKISINGMQVTSVKIGTPSIQAKITASDDWNASNSHPATPITITASTVAVPTAGTTSFTYNGTNQTYLPGNWNAIKVSCNITENKKKDANATGGHYTATISLKNKDLTAWVNPSQSTADKTQNWVINRKQIQGQWTNTTVNFDPNLTAQNPVYTVTNACTGDTVTAVLDNTECIHGGTYTRYIASLSENDNKHNYTTGSTAISTTFTINKINSPTTWSPRDNYSCKAASTAINIPHSSIEAPGHSLAGPANAPSNTQHTYTYTGDAELSLTGTSTTDRQIKVAARTIPGTYSITITITESGADEFYARDYNPPTLQATIGITVLVTTQMFAIPSGSTQYSPALAKLCLGGTTGNYQWVDIHMKVCTGTSQDEDGNTTYIWKTVF